MSCAITQCISKDCRQSVGGIKQVYITTLGAISLTGDTSSGLLLQSNFIVNDPQPFVPYELRKQVGTLTDNWQASDENGTLFYQPSVTFSIPQMNYSTRTKLFVLAQAEVVMLVLDSNARWWLVGPNNGLTVTTGNGQTGKAAGDLNGYNVTLEGIEPEPIYEVDYDAIVALDLIFSCS